LGGGSDVCLELVFAAGALEPPPALRDLLDQHAVGLIARPTCRSESSSEGAILESGAEPITIRSMSLVEPSDPVATEP